MKSKMKKTVQDGLQVARMLAPEEIRQGDFVSIMNEVIELPSFLWCGESLPTPAETPVRFTRCAADAGAAYRVMSVCIPFVALKSAEGAVRTVDLRREQVARLSAEYAKRLWGELRKKPTV